MQSSMMFLAIACLLCASPAGGAEFFVAIDGSDTNPGTAAQPLATIAKAQEVVRMQVAKGGDASVIVRIKGGTYPLDEPLVFGPESGGTERVSVTYAGMPGQRVILSGGREIGGWQAQGDGLWAARLPGGEGLDRFRNLYVDERRAVLAREPNENARPDCVQLKAAELSEDRSRFTLTFPPGVLDNLADSSELEVMVAGNWAINRKRVESVDPAAGTLLLRPPHRQGPAYILPSAGRWAYAAGDRRLADQPGEWAFDRRGGAIVYRPLAGQDMKAARVVAPGVQQLIVVAGTEERPVRNLHFKSLELAYTDWQLPAEGYMGIQACHYGEGDQPGRRWKRIPAAVSLRDALGCSVEDCVAAHLGGSAIELADGCRDCLVEGNRVFDASANGIMVGGPKIEGRVPGGCRVANNHVLACGREFYGAIGIWVGFARATRVAHNLVHDLPYSGISVGWEWNAEPTPCKENVVEWNHVYDVMNRLCDGGCIYTLGYQPGTVIRGNHLHAVHRSQLAQGAPNNGMFIDQGSKGYLFAQNVIYDTAAELVRFNQCQRDWHAWEDNHIGEEAEVRQSGRETIAAAGLQSPWKEREAAYEAFDGNLALVPEMNPVMELDALGERAALTEEEAGRLAADAGRAAAEWKGRVGQLQAIVTPELARALSRWSLPQMKDYRGVPPLEKVELKPLGLVPGGRGLVLESTIDTLPSHHPLVTRWLKVYLLYDDHNRQIRHATLTIRGERLE